MASSPLLSPTINVDMALKTNVERGGCSSTSTLLLVAGFGMVCGWAQITSYIAFRAFPTFMTGNVGLLAKATVQGSGSDAAFALALIASYLFGVWLFAAMKSMLGKSCVTHMHGIDMGFVSS